MSNNIDAYIRNFLKQYSEEINNNDFNLIYKDWLLSAARLTDILFSAGVNPLDYLTTIPPGFARELKNISSAKILEGTDKIKAEAFLQCRNLKYVYLPHSVKEIGIRAFLDCPLLEVEYNGTINDFRDIDLYFTSFDKDVIIECTDKEIKYKDVFGARYFK